MGKLGFVFPGQGSQTVGMGRDFYEQHPQFVSYLKQVDEWVEGDLSEIILNGPMEELTMTYHAQPALLAISSWIYKLIEQQGICPDYVAGHSLGEYSALVASGVLSVEDGVKIVHKRGLLMNQAVPAGEGAMAAVLGLENTILSRVCNEVSATGEIVGLANLNSPGQIVISGTKSGVDKASVAAKEAGAKRVIPLKVSGPFHSLLMEGAARKLEEEFQNVSFHVPGITVVGNVTATKMDAEEIKERLVEQVYSPVRWYESIQYMVNEGVDTIVEIGPGKVLSGLMKNIDPSIKVYSVSDASSLEEFLKSYAGGVKC